MMLIIGMSIGACVSLLFCGVLATSSAYHEGFMDGCRYMKEGDDYPDKPRKGWEGWPEVYRLRSKW